MRTVHRWLARSRIFVSIAVAFGIVRASRTVLHIPETLITTPIIAFIAGYGAILLATWIRDTYDAKHAPKGPSEAEIAAEVQLLLARARASIDREGSR